MNNRWLAILLLILLALSACTTIALSERRAASWRIAKDAGWDQLPMKVSTFVLTAFIPHYIQRADTLTIYFEGDGLAWIDSTTPSFDPTPLDPVALRLAIMQPVGMAVYLARPCQYVTLENKLGCEKKYWTSDRFSPVVIEASNQAVEQLKALYKAKNVELVGYSGGGAIAALVAAKRKDVTRLITVAGNLDHEAWTKLHHSAPLSGSLNPVDSWQTLSNLTQLHFVGEVDENIPLKLTKSYIQRFKKTSHIRLIEVDHFNHICCWVEKWPELYQQ